MSASFINRRLLPGLLLALLWLLAGCQNLRPLPSGLAYQGEVRVAQTVQFFADTAWVDDEGQRQAEQEIFDEVLRRIASARQLIVMDMFLFNDFLGKEGVALRPLSGEVSRALVAQKQAYPNMRVVLITDPVNTVYGGLRSQQFEAMREAGIEVVMTDLERLRDSNLLYSFVWRLFIKPFGNDYADTLSNPFGHGRVSLRSYLRLLNFKANHRKTLLNDAPAGWQALVTSANPHDGSSAHRNVALGFKGDAVSDLLATENTVLRLSGEEPVSIPISEREVVTSLSLQVLTESAIEQAAIAMLDDARAGDRVDLLMFYLSDRHIIDALKRAAERNVALRVLLDPNKDAFGMLKNGIPNRPVARELVKAGVAVRWCNTRGEQCHGKMLYSRRDEDSSLLLGSANFTRRNLHDLNLETNVLLRGASAEAPFVKAREHFDAMWRNDAGRRYSVDYTHYEDRSIWKAPLYRFQEFSGLSTF